jgi:hypothetical protein
MTSSRSLVVPRLPPAVTATPRKSRQQWLVVILMAVAGGVVGFFGARFGAEFLLPAGEGRMIKLLVLGTVPLVWLLVVGWHELGHLVGGRITGGRFLLFIIGPFQWQRSPAGIRFSWNRRINLFGGMAACLPVDQRDLTRRFALMIAGGPLASLVLVVLALWAAVGLAHLGWTVPQHIAVFTALLSGLIFVLTALPGEAGGFRTDGRRLLNLLGRDATARQEAALLSLTVAALAGQRPADYDSSRIEAAIGINPGSLHTLYGHTYAFQQAADCGDYGRAQRHLDEVIAGESCLPPFMRNLARADYAWLLATTTTVVAAVRAWLDTAGPTDFDPAARLRAEAAVLLMEGRGPEAAAKAREGLRALDQNSLAPVRNPFAADALEALLSRATAN